MDAITRQVGRAQRRLILEQFLSILVWTLFTALILAAIGLAIPKIWPLALNQQVWLWSWIGGALGASLLTAIIWTTIVRRSRLEAAIELDRRFGLKERVSSVLALQPGELQSEIGQALMQDAVRKVERCEVGEQFRIQPTWRLALPLAPAAVLVGLFFIPNATAPKEANASPGASSAEMKVALQKVTEKLKQKLASSEKKPEEQNLKDADLLKQIDALKELAGKDKVEHTEISLKINDLAKQVEKRKTDASSAKELQKQLGKLGKIQNGPAEKLAQALKEGDFGKAQEQLKDLVEKLKEGKLNEEEKKGLAKQMEQIKEKLQQMAEDRKDAQAALEQKKNEAIEKGDLAEAAKLQQQLDKLGANGPLEKAMEKLAEKMGECAKCMEPGKGEQGAKDAAGKLGDLAKDLEKLQEQLAEMENLDELLDQLADAKNAMNCDKCNGEGCKECQGGGNKPGDKMGQGDGKGQKPGQGMGKGRGQGERPEEENATKDYETKVAGNVKPGESVRIGDAGGRNKAGKTLEEVKAELQTSLKKDPDALDEVTLPRELRDQAKQYFEKLRKGE